MRLVSISLILILTTFTSNVFSILPAGSYDDLKLISEEVFLISIKNVINTTTTNDNDNNKALSNVCFNTFLIDAIIFKDLKNNDASSSTTSNTISTSSKRYSVGNAIKFSTYYVNKQHTYCEHWVGPKVPPLFDIGWCGSAYLNQKYDNMREEEDGDVFEPAAFGESFTEVDPSKCEEESLLLSKSLNTDNKGSSSNNNFSINLILASLLATMCLLL